REVLQRRGRDDEDFAARFDQLDDGIEQTGTDENGIALDRDERVHFNLIPSSSNCFASTCDGASLIRSCARAVLGNAMTSRSDDAFAISITMRSSPRAMPPCGGAP